MAGFLVWACLAFFALFALYFYMVGQRDVIALAHFIKSGGDVSEYRLVPALLGMVLGAVPSLLFLKILNFPLRLKAAAMLPSYVLLGLLCSTAPASVESNVLETPMLRAFLLMLVAVAAAFGAAMIRDEKSEHKPLQNYLAWNVLLTCVGVLFTVGVSANDRELHEQLCVERLASQGDWKGVMPAASDPTCQNRNITAMHALALSKQGRLADDLFTVPGLEGSESLMPDTFAAARLFGAGKMVCRWLEATPAKGSHMSVAVFLKRAVDKRMQFITDSISTGDDSIRARVLIDYYLCSLLLDRKLGEFVHELPRFYSVDDALPRHYREACIMYQRRAKMVEHPLVDEATTTSFQDFIKIMSDNKKDKDKQRQACLDMYAGTYWTYMLTK